MKILSCQNAISFVDSITNVRKKDILYNSVSSFEDKEMLVTIEKQEELRNQDILVVQSLSNNVNNAIIELLFTLDIVRMSLPRSIKLLITYMGYSRQDSPEDNKEPFSAKIIANLLSLNYISKIYVVDIHAAQTMGFFNVPSANVDLEEYIYEMLRKKFKKSDVVLVCPNSAIVKKIIYMSEKLGINYSIVLKYRPAASQNKILSLIGANVAKKDCVIIDDIVDSAGTLANVSEKLAKQGANSINAIITHGIFSHKSIDRLKNSYISRLYVSNTINSDEKIRYIKQVEVFSISDYVIDKILNDI